MYSVACGVLVGSTIAFKNSQNQHILLESWLRTSTAAVAGQRIGATAATGDATAALRRRIQ